MKSSTNSCIPQFRWKFFCQNHKVESHINKYLYYSALFKFMVID